MAGLTQEIAVEEIESARFGADLEHARAIAESLASFGVTQALREICVAVADDTLAIELVEGIVEHAIADVGSIVRHEASVIEKVAQDLFR